MFSPNLFPDNPTSVLFAPLATKEFPRKVSTIPNSYAYDHATFGVAFDSANRMMTGYNPYRGKRFIEYYNDPTSFNPTNPSDPNYALPSGQFNDFYGWPVAMNFDNNDNLYVLDANRGRVMIYKQPLVDITAPVTSVTSPSNNSTIAGVVNINATATDNVGVARVEFYIDDNLVSTQTNSPFSYSWDTRPLTNNSTHTIYTKAYDANSNTGTSSIVNVTVSDISAPTTSITSPANNAIVTGSVTINANANDNVGVAKVEFYVDGGLLSTSTIAPYTASWDTSSLAQGSSHTLTTKAYDLVNNIGTSTAVNVSIQDTISPTVSITSPTNGSQVSRNSNVTINATASDNVGVTKVEFYVNGTLKCTDTTSPYSCVWTVPAQKGVTYNLTAKAYDAANRITTSSTVTVISK